MANFPPINVFPTSPPIALGGTTAGSFQCGSQVLFVDYLATVSSVAASLIFWDEELAKWFFFPVDPVTVDPAINGGTFCQRYFTGRTPSAPFMNIYYTGAGTLVYSKRFVDGAGAA